MKFQPQCIDLVLLCGGGVVVKRLQNETPQCMVRVENRPLLLYVIDQLSAFGFDRVIISIDDNSNIEEKIGNRYALVDIIYDMSLDSCIESAQSSISKFGKFDEVILVKGNIYSNIDIFDMRNFYQFFSVKQESCFMAYSDKRKIISINANSIPDKELYSGGFYIMKKNELLSLDSKRLKEIENKNPFILSREKNKIVDSNIIPNNDSCLKTFFRDIWGYDLSRYEEDCLDDSLKQCLYCKFASRFRIAKGKYHNWKMFCNIHGRSVNKLSFCDKFKIKENKPYRRFEKVRISGGGQ